MKVSIITACLNSEKVLSDNLESVGGQQGEFELEHIFQDGGSTDRTLDLLEEYKNLADYKVSIQSEVDESSYEALNRGIKRATGDIIGILNSDDFLTDEWRLNEVVRSFENTPDLNVVYGHLDYVKEIPRGSDIDPGSSKKNDFEVVRRWRTTEFTPNRLRRGWMPPHPTVYIRKEFHERVGYYRLDMGTAADYEWMLRVFLEEKLKCAHLPKVMVKMRVGGQSNASLKNRILANSLDRRAWMVNNLHPSPWLRFIKPLRKILQWR